MKEYTLAFLPPVEKILEDFLLAGGSIKQFLTKHVKNPDERKVVAIRLLTELDKCPVARDEFDRIRRHGSAIETMLAEDELVDVARQPGSQHRVQALKLLLDKQRQLDSESKSEDNVLDRLVKQLANENKSKQTAIST